MSVAQLDGFIKALVQLRTPKATSPFSRGRRPASGIQWESKTTRSVSMRRPRPAKVK